MKQFFMIGTSILLMLILTGCGEKAVLPPDAEQVSQAVRQPFDAQATLHMGGMEAVTNLNRDGDGAFSFAFTEPAALNGMTVTMDAEKIGFSYLGMHIEGDSADVLDSAAVKAIAGALSKVAEPNGIQVGIEDGAVLVNGESESGEFQLKLDPQSRSMLSLSIPELDLVCHFSAGE